MSELRALGDCKRRPDKNFLSFGKRKTSFWIRSGGLVGVATFYFRNNFKRSNIFNGALVSCGVHDNIFELFLYNILVIQTCSTFAIWLAKNMQLKRTFFVFMVPGATTDPLLCLVGHNLFTIFLFDSK